MNIWLVILIGGLLTYAMRLSFIYFLASIAIPDIVRRALRFVPPAVLSAIVLPELMAPADDLGGNHRLAGALAVLVA
jgi:branched-subunit amino acid transport protein